MEPSNIEIRHFQEKIIRWYNNNGREFPWRNSKDPYKILVSEFLLQKTHVRKVEDIYILFIQKYPTVEKLAEAKLKDVREIIAPLGFLNRAERLINIAEKITTNYDKEIPANLEILLKFKGIGRYIATAIMIFAFGEKHVIVDTNVIKVLECEFGYYSNKKRPRTDSELWIFAQTLAPENKIREFNWGLLDYGSHLKSDKNRGNDLR